MKITKHLLAAIAVASVATLSAQANTVSGTIWEDFSQYLPGGTTNPAQTNDSQHQLDANFANVAALQASSDPGGDATFTAPSTPLSFSSYGAGDIPVVNPSGNFSNSNADYTVGSFLGTGGATGITYIHGSSSTTLDDTLFYITGSVTVTNGQSFIVEHDDGVELQIGSTIVTPANAEGPTAADDTSYTWSGASGTYSFQLVYTEVTGAPAVLYTNLPLISPPTVPDGGMTVALLGMSVGGLAFLRRKFFA
jgi:hypothetical protein